jgi:hypothetical protein
VSHQGTFKEPTIKGTSRAYVRLFEYFETPEKWLEFLQRYRVERVPFGMQLAGDCAVRVIDPATSEVAVIGLEVPNEIKYHTYIATGRSFWTEEFASATHRRRRVIEVGYAQALKDEVVPR